MKLPKGMYRPTGVNFPVWSATWAQIEEDGPEDFSVRTVPAVVLAGGGGACKSGVPNKIAFLTVQPRDHTISHGTGPELETSPNVCNSIAVSRQNVLLAAAFGQSLTVFAILAQGLAKLVEVQADFAEKEGGLNSLYFSLCQPEAGPDGHPLAAGCEDGVVRVWPLEVDRKKLDAAAKDIAVKLELALKRIADAEKKHGEGPQEKDDQRHEGPQQEGGPDEALPEEIADPEGPVQEQRKKKSPAPKIPPIRSLEEDWILKTPECKQLKGHTKPVTCVRFHPAPELAQLLISSAKDGTCKIWDWTRGELLADLAASAGLPASVKQASLQCRSAGFLPGGHAALSLQNAARGKAYLTVWDLKVTPGSGGSKGGSEALHVSAEPRQVKLVSDHAATNLAVRADGHRVAVSNAEGKVVVFSFPELRKVKEYAAHELPVTSLAFAPLHMSDAGLGGYDLLSASADSTLCLLKSQGHHGRSLLRIILLTLLALAVAIMVLCLGMLALPKLTPGKGGVRSGL